MRSARILLATAAASAALALATPGTALAGDDGGRDDSSYNKEHDSGSDRDKGSGDKESGGDSYDSDSDGPRGGVHTGGGALAAVSSDDWSSDSGDDSRFDPESYKDKGDGGGSGGKDSGGKGDSGGDEPRGGMHTGGGGLADSGGVTMGGAAVLAAGALGAYALRRKKAAGPAS